MNLNDAKPFQFHLPKTKRGLKTMQNILDASEVCFLKHGYYNTKIADITHTAKVGQGTFYVYFPDKLSVYKYLLSTYSHKIRKEIAISIANMKQRFDMERQGLLVFLQYIKKYPHTYKIIWESLSIDASLFEDYYSTFAMYYIEALKKAQINQEIVADLNVEVLAYCLMGISNFIGIRWVMFEQGENLEAVVDEVMKLLKSGMFQ